MKDPFFRITELKIFKTSTVGAQAIFVYLIIPSKSALFIRRSAASSILVIFITAYSLFVIASSGFSYRFRLFSSIGEKEKKPNTVMTSLKQRAIARNCEVERLSLTLIRRLVFLNSLPLGVNENELKRSWKATDGLNLRAAE